MKAYQANPKHAAPQFTDRAAVIAKCYDVVSHAKKPLTVAQVRAKVEKHFGESCAVRASLHRLELGKFIKPVNVKSH